MHPKVVLAAKASFKTATTLANLQLLKQARERLGQAVPELDGILKELSERDIALRGEEKINKEELENAENAIQI